MVLFEFTLELKLDINEINMKNYCFRALQKYFNP